MNRNDKLDIGLKLLMSEGSRFGFFSIGVTIAIFIHSVTVQLVIDVLIKQVKKGARIREHSFSSHVGMGSA